MQVAAKKMQVAILKMQGAAASAASCGLLDATCMRYVCSMQARTLHAADIKCIIHFSRLQLAEKKMQLAEVGHASCSPKTQSVKTISVTTWGRPFYLEADTFVEYISTVSGSPPQAPPGPPQAPPKVWHYLFGFRQLFLIKRFSSTL